MNQLLKQIYETKQVEDAEGNIINPFPTATPVDTGQFLYELISQYDRKRTIEIGMAYGLSTLFICQAHHDRGSGTHTSVDPFQSQHWKSIGVLNVQRAGLAEQFRFFEMRSDEILPKLIEQGETYDFAFIDGAHFFDYALLDFFYVDKLLEIGGYVAFDDIWMPSVRRVISYVLRNRHYQLVPINPQIDWLTRVRSIAYRFLTDPLERHSLNVKLLPGNICVLQKTAEDERKWDFHRSF